MARNIKSSKNGTVAIDSTLVSDVTNISGTMHGQHDGHEYASSSTAGKKYEIAGHSKKSGSFEVLSDVLDAALTSKIGILIGLTIKSDGSVELFDGSAILKVGETVIDVEGGGIERTTIEWAETE